MNVNDEIERILRDHQTFPSLRLTVEKHNDHNLMECPMITVELSVSGAHVHSDNCYDMEQLDLVCEHEEGFQPLTAYSFN